VSFPPSRHLWAALIVSTVVSIYLTLVSGAAPVDASTLHRSHDLGQDLSTPHDLATAWDLSNPTGHDYFLSPTGNDSGPGTLAQPWLTLSAAASKMSPGDVLYLRGGTYWGAASIHVSGTASAAIVFTSYPGERALINNPTSSKLNDTLSVYGAYLTFDHLTFSDQHKVGQAVALAYGSHDNTVSNCEVYGGQGSGIIVSGDNNLIVNNLIHDNGTHVSRDHGIYLEGANNTIRGNTIYNNFTFGIQLYNGYGRIAGGNLIERNYVYHNGFGSAAGGFNYNAAIILATGQPNTIVRYNILCNNAQYGLYANDSTVTGNQVVSNVSCDNPSGGFFYDRMGAPCTSTGNVSYNDQGFSLGLNTPVTSDNNDYYLAGGTPMFMRSWVLMSLASFRTTTGQDVNSQIADPTFTAGPINGFDWTKASSYNFCTPLIPALCTP
jgi:parallel beta-helix repeat protein